MIQYIEKNTDKVISLKLCKLQRRTNMEKYRRLKYYLLSMTKNDEKRVLRSDELESKFQDIVDNKMIPIGQTGHKAIQVDFSDGSYVIELIQQKGHIYYLKLCIGNLAYSVALRDKKTLESGNLDIGPTQSLEIYTFCIIDFTTRVLSYVGVNGSPRVSVLKDWLNGIYKEEGYGTTMALICSPNVLDELAKKKRITNIKVDIAVPSDTELERIGVDEKSFDDMRGTMTRMLSYEISAMRGKSLFEDPGKIRQIVHNLINGVDSDSIIAFKGFGKDDGETTPQVFNLLDYGTTVSDKIDRKEYDKGDDERRMQMIYSTYNTKRADILSIVQCKN